MPERRHRDHPPAVPVDARRRALRGLAVGSLAAARHPGAWALGAAASARAQPSERAASPDAGTSRTAAPRVTEVAGGFEHPWSVAFLPDGRRLVTERSGRLRIVSLTGRLSAPIEGVPKVHASGQGGLLDVVLGPRFERDNAVYLSYSEPVDGGARTAVVRAEFADGPAPRLRSVTRIFAQKDAPGGGHHFGSRLVFARDETLFVTLGDRFSHRDRVQQLDNHYGKIVRIRSDGDVPPDNPFVDREGALPDIHSYGHRNVQGAALHPDGELWTNEHGPQGGDEVNIERRGGNYGWPVVTHGREYVTRFSIGEATERSDVVSPSWQWTPSIAPSGMAFCTSRRYGDWRGSAFVGSLRFRLLSRLVLAGDNVVHEERLLGELRQRIRDVRQAPDGLLYLLTDESRGSLLRIEPTA